MRTMLAAASLLALVQALASGTTHAQPRPSVRFAYEVDPAAGETCPTAAAITTSVEQHLGRPIFTEDTRAGGAIRVAITRGADAGVDVAISAIEPDGTSAGARQLHGTGDCGTMTNTITLVVTLLVVEHGETIAIAPPPEPPPPPPPAQAPPPPAPVPPPAPPRSEPWSAASGVSGLANVGLLPGVALGAAVGFEVDPRSVWPVRIGLGIWLPAYADGPSGTGAKVDAWAASLAVCPHLSNGRVVVLDVCAGIGAGLASAAGTGFDEVFETTDPLLWIEAGPALTVLFGARVGMRLGIAGLIHPLPLRYLGEQPQPGGYVELEVYEASVVSARAELGLVVLIAR